MPKRDPSRLEMYKAPLAMVGIAPSAVPPGAMTSTHVVIVVGGVIGASIAYHLSRRSAGRVIVLEKDLLGSGSTGENAGGIRLQFSTEVNVRLSQRALPRLEAFKDGMGLDRQFHQLGYLFLITAERDIAPFGHSLALWHRLGVPAKRLSAAEAQDLFPERMDDVKFATFCAKEATPTRTPSSRATSRAAASAVSSSVRAPRSPASSRITERSSRCARLATESFTPTVIDAAGAWGAKIGAMARRSLRSCRCVGTSMGSATS